MKPFQATCLGIVLSAGLALTAVAKIPQDLVQRYLAVQESGAADATWRDWHPEATHTITIKYGLGQPDDRFSYVIADYATLPDPATDPVLAEAMQGYQEIERSTPQITTAAHDDGTRVTATTQVSYTWQDFEGTMVQTDEFFILSYFGASVIRSLNTTFDYR